MASSAQEHMRKVLGPEADDVNVGRLGPRQYDPRRIVREALADDGPAAAPAVATLGAVGGNPPRRVAEWLPLGHAAPFDSEST